MSKNTAQNLIIFGTMFLVVGFLANKHAKLIKEDIQKNFY